MLFFFFFCLFRVCQSEWPPFMCEKEVAIRKNRVILTSSTQQQREYSCQMQETFTNATFIEFERKYGQQRFQEVHDSIMGFSITSKKRHLFNIQIHNDHIESDASQRKCYDIFTSKRIWMKIQLHPLPELRKTFVSVHISHNNVYSPCFNFELNTIIEEFSLKMKNPCTAPPLLHQTKVPRRVSVTAWESAELWVELWLRAMRVSSCWIGSRLPWVSFHWRHHA